MVWMGPLTSDCEPVWDPSSGQCVSLGLDAEIARSIDPRTTTVSAALAHPDRDLRPLYRHRVRILTEIMNAIRLGTRCEVGKYDLDWIEEDHAHLWSAVQRQVNAS